MTSSVLLDVNVLLALSHPAHQHHDKAHARFGALESWATTPVTETGLLRLLLTEAVIGSRMDADSAMRQLRLLRTAPGWGWLPDATTPTNSVIDTSVLRGHRQVTDLHLVDLAATHAVRLATFDAGIRKMLKPADQDWVDLWV